MTDHSELIAKLEAFDDPSLKWGAITIHSAAAHFLKAADAIRELSQERDEARALQRDYRREQLLAENDAAMVRAVWSNLQPKLEAKVAALRKQVEMAKETLDKLQRLGNEPLLGNSIGNTIARSCLRDIVELDAALVDKQGEP